MGKKAQGAQAERNARMQKELTEACKNHSVDEVLRIFEEWAAGCKEMPTSAYTQTLAALGKTAEDEHSVDSAVRQVRFQHAKQIFAAASDAFGSIKKNMGESMYTLMIRLAARAGDPAAAVGYLDQMRKPPSSVRPKIRTFIPILEACMRCGASEQAEQLYREDLFPTCAPTEATAVWNTESEDRLWESVFALRLQAWRKGLGLRPMTKSPEALFNILKDIESVCPQLRGDGELPIALEEAMRALDWRAEWRSFDDRGCCCVTDSNNRKMEDHVLSAVYCSEDQLQNLATLIERLATEHVEERAVTEWHEFKAWLKDNGSTWDAVIDGANVGHHNQNWEEGRFSHDQIDTIVEQCRAMGRRSIAVVLRERWLRPELDFRLPAIKHKRRRLPQLDNNSATPSTGSSNLRAAKPAYQSEVDKTDALDGMASKKFKAHADNSGVQKDVEKPDEAKAMNADKAGSQAAPSPSPDRAQEDEDPVDPQEVEKRERVRSIGERWRQQGVLVPSPHSIDDDWVGLYIAMTMTLKSHGKDVQLISNDEFRDHFWRMRSPLALRAWRERHVTRYYIHSERCTDAEPSGNVSASMKITSTQLFPPQPYSICVQRANCGSAWYFPVRVSSVETQPGIDVVNHGNTGRADAVQWRWLSCWDPADPPWGRVIQE